MQPDAISPNLFPSLLCQNFPQVCTVCASPAPQFYKLACQPHSIKCETATEERRERNSREPAHGPAYGRVIRPLMMRPQATAVDRACARPPPRRGRHRCSGLPCRPRLLSPTPHRPPYIHTVKSARPLPPWSQARLCFPSGGESARDAASRAQQRCWIKNHTRRRGLAAKLGRGWPAEGGAEGMQGGDGGCRQRRVGTGWRRGCAKGLCKSKGLCNSMAIKSNNMESGEGDPQGQVCPHQLPPQRQPSNRLVCKHKGVNVQPHKARLCRHGRGLQQALQERPPAGSRAARAAAQGAAGRSRLHAEVARGHAGCSRGGGEGRASAARARPAGGLGAAWGTAPPAFFPLGSCAQHATAQQCYSHSSCLASSPL